VFSHFQCRVYFIGKAKLPLNKPLTKMMVIPSQNLSTMILPFGEVAS
jgi:hypothetical protein